MALLARIPPGRAGRLWLHRRLDTAERGRDQLDHKLRILLADLQRLRVQADRRREEWAVACETAQTWLLRAAILGGQDAIRHAIATEPVVVELTWTTTMGLSYPAEAEVTIRRDPGPPPLGNAAVPRASEAFEVALRAGIHSAAAEEAVRRLEAELAVTRRRLRALDKRWLPWLREALTGLELSLEQAEQEDGMRLRRAAADTSRQQASR